MRNLNINVCGAALMGMAALSFVPSSMAFAPAAPSSGATPSAGAVSTSNADDSVVVVIGKRNQELRNVAGKVDLLTGDALEKIGARDAEDIFKLSPGVQFNKGSADGSFLTIRGVGTNTSSDNTNVGQLPTGIYIEDVPFTDPFQYVSSPDIAAFDLEAVKVLRGPQGALYGSGSLGGAINYTFRKPDLDGLGGEIQITGDAAQGGETQASLYGAVNIPIVSDKLAIRIVGQFQNDPGCNDNIGTRKRNANGRSVEGGRILLLAKPNENLTIDAMYMYQSSA